MPLQKKFEKYLSLCVGQMNHLESIISWELGKMKHRFRKTHYSRVFSWQQAEKDLQEVAALKSPWGIHKKVKLLLILEYFTLFYLTPSHSVPPRIYYWRRLVKSNPKLVAFKLPIISNNAFLEFSVLKNKLSLWAIFICLPIFFACCSFLYVKGVLWILIYFTI